MLAIRSRRLISLLTLFAFAVLAFTGLVMYITPPGRVAYWADWRFLGLTKQALNNIHVIVSMLFLVTAIWHICLNWKPVVNYMKNSARKISLKTPELSLALLITMGVTLGAFFEWPGVGGVLAAVDRVKAHWETEYGNPPYGHAELSSLEAFCRHMGFDVATAQKTLRANRIRFDGPRQTLVAIARANKIAPQRIFTLLKAAGTTQSQTATPKRPQVGLGRKTLTQVCAEENRPVAAALRKLAAAGITAQPEMTMKQIARLAGTDPHDIYAKLQ